MKQIVSAIALVAALLGRAEAITFVPMTFEQLVAEATAIVYARVADVHGRWTPDRRGIDSVMSLEALRYLKGDLGAIVTMRLPGGEVGGRLHVLPGAPTLREGDLVVLFLGARGPAMLSPVGLTQGVFRVTVDVRTGRVLVIPPPIKGSAVGRVVRGAADRQALTLDAFAAEVQRAVESGR